MRSRGYRHHPQLHRFQQQQAPRSAINRYLAGILSEANARGYAFDASKVGPVRSCAEISGTAHAVDMKILAIAGSLRAASINSAFCRATALLAPPGVQVELFLDLGDIPGFNQDLEISPPPAVRSLRAAVHAATALVIASPEYAHGVSGVMKNALDWLVSYEGTVGKPVALVNTSARAHQAYDALREILTTMSADVVPAAAVTLPLLGTCSTEAQMVSSPQVSRAIKGMIEALTLHVSGQSVPAVNFPII